MVEFTIKEIATLDLADTSAEKRIWFLAILVITYFMATIRPINEIAMGKLKAVVKYN